MADVRRSNRRTVRPVEFWNFEKPNSKSEKIVYNLADLSKCSVYDTMSVKYAKRTIGNSNRNDVYVSKVSVNKAKETESVGGRGKIRDKRNLPASQDSLREKTSKACEKKSFDDNQNQTESADVRRKIVEDKRKSLDARRDGSSENYNEDANEANEKESSNNNLSGDETAADGRREIVKDVRKLRDVRRDATRDNSEENANKADKKDRLTHEKPLATCPIFKAPISRKTKKNTREENAQVTSERTKNDTVDQQGNFASFSYTVNSESMISRCSGRIRTKPLEFWNFEKVKVKSLESGELSVVHHKQMLPPPFIRKGKDTAAAAAVREKSKVSRQKHSPTSSPSKRKISPICSETNKEVCIEDENPSKRKRTSDEQDSSLLPAVHLTKLSNLSFCQCKQKDFKCFLARSYQDTERDIYAGFVFLEEGRVIWKTTRETNLYVLEGKGTLLIVGDAAEGIALQLKDNFQATITSGKKVAFTKDEECKMLKLFLVLGCSSGSSLSIYQDSPISDTSEEQVIHS